MRICAIRFAATTRESPTADPAAIGAWWDKRPESNIGVATGDDLVVVDYDTKNGKAGEKALVLHASLDLPKTYGVRTATGGYHLYFRPDAPIPNSVSKIAPDVDVRGARGFVVGPGSTIDGAEYRAGRHDEIARMPPWLAEQARALSQRRLMVSAGMAARAWCV